MTGIGHTDVDVPFAFNPYSRSRFMTLDVRLNSELCRWRLILQLVPPSIKPDGEATRRFVDSINPQIVCESHSLGQSAQQQEQ